MMDTTEQQLWDKYVASGREIGVRDALLEHYTPWARQVYNRTIAKMRPDRRTSDLFQVALIGLWRAIEKYPDNIQKCSFRKFANMRIKGRILQEYKENADITRGDVDKYVRICEKEGKDLNEGWRRQELLAQAKGNIRLDTVSWECMADSQRVPDQVLLNKEVSDVLKSLLKRLSAAQKSAIAMICLEKRPSISKSEWDKTRKDRREALQYLKYMLEHMGIKRSPRKHYPGIRLKASKPELYHAYETSSTRGGKYHYIGRYGTLTDAVEAQTAYEDKV